MKTPIVSSKRHRFPPEIIGHAVWLYFRFALSFRDVEELLAVLGVVVTDETIRQWCEKFGQVYADGVRRKRPQTGEKRTIELNAHGVLPVGVRSSRAWQWSKSGARREFTS